MVIAGSDSTAASIIHVVDVVSRNPILQRKIQQEIDEAFPGKPDAEWIPKSSETTVLTLTKAVLYETLRLRPTAAIGFERIVTRPGTVFGGFKLPPGTAISVPTYSIQRNTDVYPDPEAFVPERWLAEDASQQHKSFNVFSTGPRSCIGQ